MRLRKKPGSRYWYAEFWLTKGRKAGHAEPRGRFFSLSTRTTDKTLAQQIANERRKEKLRELYGIPSDKEFTLQDLLDRYRTWLKTERSERTLKRAERAIRNVLDRLKVRFPDQITREKLAKYRAQRQEEVSVRTVAVESRHLKAFLRRCVREKWLNRVPCDIEMPKLPSGGRVVFLSDSEVEALLASLTPLVKVGRIRYSERGPQSRGSDFSRMVRR